MKMIFIMKKILKNAKNGMRNLKAVNMDMKMKDVINVKKITI